MTTIGRILLVEDDPKYVELTMTMSSEKHFSLPERQKYFPASSPRHTADTSTLAA
jgi:hypothetical protein